MLACLFCKIKSKAKYCIIYDLFGRFIPWCDFMLAVFSVELRIFQHYFFFPSIFEYLKSSSFFLLLGIALLMGNQGNRETVWVSLDCHLYSNLSFSDRLFFEGSYWRQSDICSTYEQMNSALKLHRKHRLRPNCKSKNVWLSTKMLYS